MDPDIRYAKSGGVAIAYQVVGDGPTDLIYVPDYLSNLVYGWQSQRWRGFYDRLARSFRLILFDKRGTGLSDFGGQFPSLETRMDDVRAVLDAVGSSSAVLLGSLDGCSMAALYAATYPERTRAIALFHPITSFPQSETEELRAELARLRDEWGTQAFCDEMLSWNAPSLYESEEERLWFANWIRVGASPAVAYAMNRAWAETDLTEVLPAVRVPTIVFYRDCYYEALALDVAQRIPSAGTLRVSGRDPWGIFLSPEIPDEVERFVGGETAPHVPDTVLATLLFTDIIGSTERAATPPSATAAGASCSIGTTSSCGASSRVSAARRRTRRATASSRRSTGRRGRFDARPRSGRPSPSWAWRSALGSTPASASCWMTRSPGSRSRSARAWRRRLGRGRYSCRRRSRTWSQARVSRSKTAASGR